MNAEQFADYFQNYDPSYEILFQDDWSGYEDSGWLFLFERDGKYYRIEGGTSALCYNDSPPNFKDELEEITADEVLASLEEWEKILADTDY